jgi:hypothetical protein
MANIVNSHTVSGYLDLLGAGHKRVTETVTLMGFSINARFYRISVPVEIRTSPQWVTFRALLVNNLSNKELAAVATYLGYLNSQCRAVRYTLFERSVFLSTEIHTSRLMKETFVEALWALVSSANKTTIALRVLSTNPRVADTYMAIHRDASVSSQELTPDDVLMRFNLRPTGLEKLIKARGDTT